MKLILTGGNGYLGIHVLNRLLKIKNIKILVIDDYSSSNPKLIKKIFSQNKKKIILKKVDITNKRNLFKIFKNHQVDNVIHLAAKIDAKESIKKKNIYIKTNLEGTKNLIDLSNLFKVKRFIFASSAAVYGNSNKKFCTERQNKTPINPYGLSKLLAEEYIIKNLPRTNYYILRIFNLIGLRNKHRNLYINRSSVFFKLIKASITKNKKIYLNSFKKNKTNYTTERDFVDVDDVAKIIVKTLYIKKKNVVLNCGTGVKTKIIDLINLFENSLKIKFNIILKKKPLSDPNSIIASTKLFNKLFKSYKMKNIKNIKHDILKLFLL